jgi:integrative and conjugative element protein (TIGR02256 family)
MTEGQESALLQLQDIEAAGTALKIMSVTPPTTERGALLVEISVDCSSYERAKDGLPLADREHFVLNIPAGFPLRLPEVGSKDKRFAGFPHVQWGHHFCLYQASDTEWHPEDGMFGFIERLDVWLTAGAVGQLDPMGLPLHPPAVYTSRSEFIVPQVNTPTVESPWWAGYAEITEESTGAIFLGNWHAYTGEVPKGRLAGAILLPEEMPFEYPITMRELLQVLGERNVSAEVLRAILDLTAIRTEAGKPLYILIGAPMRGIAGSEKRRQHLACWYVSPERAASLRELKMSNATAEGVMASAAFAAWSQEAAIEWCPVREARPEIVVSRDSGSPMAWWRGKRAVILGCGALGSAVGLMITRAGARAIKLYDSSAVPPGVLVRQHFDRRHIGYKKASATKFQLQAINPDADISDHPINIIEALRKDPDGIFDADIVINTTASLAVSTAIDKFIVDSNRPHPPILSLAVGHRAEYGLMTLATTEVSGTVIDLDRRSKIAIANASNGREYFDEFWPEDGTRGKLLQPEPGCSDPTFLGSAADVFGLSAAFLNIGSRWMGDGTAFARAAAVRALHVQSPRQSPALLEFTWASERVFLERKRGFQIRLSRDAERDLLAWIRTSKRKRGSTVETGGLLFGEVNEFLKIIWISEVSGPPPDSIASAHEFVCGIQGTRELHQEKCRRTRGSVRFVGMWHTHPGGVASPSGTDLAAVEKLRAIPEQSPRSFIMLIIGGRMPTPQIEGFLFGR